MNDQAFSNLVDEVDRSVSEWRQGDVSCDESIEFLHLADLDRPHSPPALKLLHQAGESETQELGIQPILDKAIEGVAVLTQTCDLIRSCRDRSYVEVAPLVKVPQQFVEEVRLGKRSGFAYVPCMEQNSLVADLDRIMTVEKAVLGTWLRIEGRMTEKEAHDFRNAIGRKRSRFPFPDKFVEAMADVRKHFGIKHSKQTPEGDHLRALREIRVYAKPYWDAPDVDIRFWFIKKEDPTPCMWDSFMEQWISKFRSSPGLRVGGCEVRALSELTAQEYVESDSLELDTLTIKRRRK